MSKYNIPYFGSEEALNEFFCKVRLRNTMVPAELVSRTIDAMREELKVLKPRPFVSTDIVKHQIACPFCEAVGVKPKGYKFHAWFHIANGEYTLRGGEGRNCLYEIGDVGLPTRPATEAYYQHDILTFFTCHGFVTSCTHCSQRNCVDRTDAYIVNTTVGGERIQRHDWMGSARFMRLKPAVLAHLQKDHPDIDYHGGKSIIGFNKDWELDTVAQPAEISQYV